MKNWSKKARKFCKLFMKIINSKTFNIINTIYMTLILLGAAYLSYGKWTFWLFIIAWLFIFPITFNIFYKLLKKFVDKKKNKI